MKKIMIVFVLVLVGILSGCSEDIDEVGEIVELNKTEYDLPEETLGLLEDNEIEGIYQLDGLFYIVYVVNGNHILVSLDSDFNIVYELDGFGFVNYIEMSDEGVLLVSHFINTGYMDIVNEQGTRLDSIDTGYHFIVDYAVDFGYESMNYLDLEDGYFIFIEEVETEEYNRAFQVIKTSGVDEEILYEFTSQYTHSAYMLSDGSFVFRYKERDIELDTVVHMDIDGTIIHQETVNYMGIELVSDGYILELFGEGASYSYTRRDLDSNDVWSYYGSYLYLMEEMDGYVVYHANQTSFYDRMKIYDDGSIETYSDEDQSMFSESLRAYLDEDTFIYIDYSMGGDGLYNVEFYTSDEIYIKQIDYEYRIEEFVANETLYIYGVEGGDTVVDLYDFDGNLLETDTFEGDLVSVLENGHYIVSTDTGWIKELDGNMNQVWKIQEEFDVVEYFEISEDLVLINLKHFNPLPVTFMQYIQGGAVIIKDGIIVSDFSDLAQVFMIYNGEEFIYFFAPVEGVMYQVDSLGETRDQIDIICVSSGAYYSIEEGKLVIYEIK